MSSTAYVRRGAPARPALTAGETPSYARVRAPRPWAASLQRPAAKILFAGGLTLAGWLLGAALTGSTASAAEAPTCPEVPVASTVDHAAKPLLLGRHHKNHHHQTDVAACPVQPKADTADSAEPPAAAQTQPAETTKDTPAPKAAGTAEVSGTTETTEDTEPAATTKATSSGGLVNGLVGGTLNALSSTVRPTAETTKDTSATGGGLVGGLVGGVLDVVGSTLSTVTDTLGTVTDTLSHTVLAPLTQPPAGNPNAPVLLPLDDVLGPVLGGNSNAGGVTTTVPVATAVVAPAPVTTTETAATATTADQPQVTRVALAHPAVRHAGSLPAVQEQPRDSGTHATGGGGDSTPGLPGGTTAPSAPAPTATSGHDGPGGARHAFAVRTDDVTTTQLKLIGTSRDHEVDGAGREAALPTTSPD
ncbi:hypothetical protein [Amycolatopsis sp. CA-128772]|uniref:hypothetical protein n=1 Tax=Amycolatopsis sp. CA-128772 TaxID=2073159 RepID=UPI001E419233|nr:hypothetical protein [Amycolatopsis sp. CA-128772]